MMPHSSLIWSWKVKPNNQTKTMSTQMCTQRKTHFGLFAIVKFLKQYNLPKKISIHFHNCRLLTLLMKNTWFTQIWGKDNRFDPFSEWWVLFGLHQNAHRKNKLKRRCKTILISVCHLKQILWKSLFIASRLFLFAPLPLNRSRAAASHTCDELADKDNH